MLIVVLNEFSRTHRTEKSHIKKIPNLRKYIVRTRYRALCNQSHRGGGRSFSFKEVYSQKWQKCIQYPGLQPLQTVFKGQGPAPAGIWDLESCPGNSPLLCCSLSLGKASKQCKRIWPKAKARQTSQFLFMIIQKQL